MQGSSIAAWTAAALLASSALARSALARPPAPRPVEGDVTLEVHRDPSAAACPDAAALRERAADLFDFRDPFVAPGSDASSHVRLEITRTAAAYQATLRIVDAAGGPLATSTEHHADCDALVWVLAHRVAIMIARRPRPAPPAEPSTSPSAEPSAPPPAAPSAAPPPAAAPAPPASAPPPPVACADPCTKERRAEAPPAFALNVGAGGLLTIGFTADVGPGVWLGVAAQRGWLSLGVELRGVFPAVTFTYEPGRSSYATTLSGLVVPCARYRALSACAFVEVGSYLFTIPGDTPAELATLVTVGPRLGVDVPIAGGLGMRAFGEAGFHPHSPVFHVRATSALDASSATWVTPDVSGVLGVGLTWTR